MLILVGLGVYLYRKEIKSDKAGISTFNAIWKIRSRGFVWALLLGGGLMILKEFVVWIWY